MEQLEFRDMADAPKDGTLVLLLVDYDCHPTEDEGVGPSVGFNTLGDTGVDEWIIAGWNWTHDEFCNGVGVPIGWYPMPGYAPGLMKRGYRPEPGVPARLAGEVLP